MNPWRALVVILVAPIVFLTAPSRAADFNPTTVAELISAINTANANGIADTIHLTAGATYTFTATNNNINALPVITSELTIDGNDATLLRNTSAPKLRFFYVDPSGKLFLRNITISGGSTGIVQGGCIFNRGYLDITHSTIASCNSMLGGAIYNNGQMIALFSSSLHDNSTMSGGAGGVLFSNTGTVDIMNSTLAKNSAPGVGSNGVGGALFISGGSANILFSTFANNSANIAGGILQDTASVQIKGTLIAHNTATSGPDCVGTIASGGYNIIGNTAQCTVVAKTTDATNLPTAQTGLSDFVAVPGYFSLADGNKAIGAVALESCTNTSGEPVLSDQLQHARDVRCDIGAIQAYCNDGVTQAVLGEQCDDGPQKAIDDGVKNADYAACTSQCKKAVCGDSLVHAGVETCDDGNQINTDGCPNTCLSPTCGDGIVQTSVGETCDDGAKNNNTGACLPTCKKAACGDGVVLFGVEECDGGSGCDSACKKIAAPTPPPVIGDTTTPPTTTGVSTTDTTSSGTTPAPTTGASGGCSVIPNL